MMAHLQGRNMYLLLSDVDVVLLNEYIYIYIHYMLCIITNCVSYISLKLYTLKHFHCSYMFR
jgi:hypothetical protein